MALTVRIKGDASHLDKVLAQTKISMRGLGGAVKGIGMGMAGLAIGAAAATAAVGAMYYKLALIGEAAQTSENRLANIVDQMGLFGAEANNVSSRLSKLADEQGRLLGIDNKTIRLTQSKLATFKELLESADDVGGAFDRATMAALNMAAAGFGSAEQNAVQLGKALNDPIKGINSLTRSGITFTAAEKDKIAALVQGNKMLEAQDVILKAIEMQVGGTAKATADSSAMMKESFSQLIQEFSKPFATSISGLPGQIEGAFPSLKEKAGMAGSIISRAIQDGIRGDFDGLAEIAMIGGRVIAEGIKAGLKGGLVGIGESVLQMAEQYTPGGYIARKATGSETPFSGYTTANKDEFLKTSMQDAVDAIMASIRDKYAPVGVSPSAQRLYDQGSRSDSPGMTEDMRRMLRVLEDINRKTSPITY